MLALRGALLLPFDRMQSASEQWLKGHRRAAPPDPSTNKQLATILSVPLPPTSALFSKSGAQFVRCSADGKDAALVSARLDTYGHFLRVGSSKEEESAVDIRKLRVSFACVQNE